jgi:putative hemolysin
MWRGHSWLPRSHSCDRPGEARPKLVVVTANHPFGFLEPAILAAVLRRVRPDFKIVANSLLAHVPELRAGFIFVNPYGGSASFRENRRSMRESLDWLENGGMLALFPAGDVARLNWRDRGVVDPPWNPSVAHLIRLAGCPALPVYFKGANGLVFSAHCIPDCGPPACRAKR